MRPTSIGGINLLPEAEKREIYTSVVAPGLLERFGLPPLTSPAASELVKFKFVPGSSDVQMSLFHRPGFQDPIFFGHLADTLNGQVHVLLYILNDPDSPRFDVDRMPDGSSTRFGTSQRNLQAERAALDAGLAPGQVRRGLRLLGEAVPTFERFISSLGHDMYFIEPLYYHNAIIFERRGFTYQQGRKLMERIEQGFSEQGDLHAKLDDSSPFRTHPSECSIRLRSWAIHDGILGEPFTNVTMYKQVGKSAGINTCPSCGW